MNILKISLSFFCLYLLIIAPQSAFPAGKEFFEEQSRFFVFQNNDTKLLMDKETFRVELQDTEGNVHYSEYQQPEFEVDDSWISASGKIPVKNILQNAVELFFWVHDKYPN